MLVRAPRRFVFLAISLAIVVALAACGGSDDDETTGSAGADSSETPAADASSGGDAASEGNGSNGDRAFGIDRDQASQAIKSATKADRVEWDGDTVRVVFEEKVGNSIPMIFCTGVEAVLADNESAVIVHSDSEYDCNDRS